MATNYIEILNDASVLAGVAASGAFIHARAAELASEGAPIAASDIVRNVAKSIRSITK